MPKRQWVRTSTLASALGVSSKYLHSRRGRAFKEGQHWYRVNPESWRPDYRWHFDRCHQLLGVSPSDRPSQREA